MGPTTPRRQDSSVKDFLRTYGVTAEPKRPSPSVVTYSDRFDDVRRTFTVTYNPSPEPGGYDYARITARARAPTQGGEASAGTGHCWGRRYAFTTLA